MDFLSRLFESDFMPHGHCYYWQPEIVWLHVISDAVITLAYFSIPALLLQFVRLRRDIRYSRVFVLFGIFIVACGSTHAMEIWTLWHGTYRLAGVLKAITAVASIATAAALVPILPQALRIPSHAQLSSAIAELAKQVVERKATQERLDAVVRDLKRSNAELERFAYVASHDLQEPLRAITSYTQLLAKRYKGKLDADADDFIGFAVDGAQRMQALIKGLLELSRVDSRGQQVRAVATAPILETVVRLLERPIQEAGAVLEIGTLPTVKGDEAQISQLFQNLLSNALKFRRPGVVPTLGVEAVEAGAVWHFTVSDNGIGVPPEHQERVFGMFERLHGDGEYPGTGIGLALCKRIVERHGGRIWLESSPGVGSRFHFTLLSADAALPASAPA